MTSSSRMTCNSRRIRNPEKRNHLPTGLDIAVVSAFCPSLGHLLRVSVLWSDGRSFPLAQIGLVDSRLERRVLWADRQRDVPDVHETDDCDDGDRYGIDSSAAVTGHFSLRSDVAVGRASRGGYPTAEGILRNDVWRRRSSRDWIQRCGDPRRGPSRDDEPLGRCIERSSRVATKLLREPRNALEKATQRFQNHGRRSLFRMGADRDVRTPNGDYGYDVY